MAGRAYSLPRGGRWRRTHVVTGDKSRRTAAGGIRRASLSGPAGNGYCAGFLCARATDRILYGNRKGGIVTQCLGGFRVHGGGT